MRSILPIGPMQRRIKKKTKRRHGRLSSCYRNKNPIQTFILAERTQILLSKQRWRTATETMRCQSPSFWYFGRTNPNLLGCLGLTAILGNSVTAPIQIGAYWPPGERGLAPQHTHHGLYYRQPSSSRGRALWGRATWIGFKSTCASI